MTAALPKYRIVATSSPEDALWEQVVALRLQVFAGEQGINDVQASDADDLTGVHALAIDDDAEVPTLIGAGRITFQHRGRNEALIAWVVTDPGRRKQGVGTGVMQALIAEADARGIEETLLAAQAHATDFYRALGFSPIGRPYESSGIPHQWMSRPLPRRRGLLGRVFSS